MELNDLTPEQLEQAKASKMSEDILALAKEMGYELSDEELDGVAGGLAPESVMRTMIKQAKMGGASLREFVVNMPWASIQQAYELWDKVDYRG